MAYTTLPHDCVGDVAGFNLSVYGEMLLSDGAVPNVVVSFAAPYESTIMRF
jgi:hypothetical protein